MPLLQNDSGLYTFLFRYRKLLTVICILDLLFGLPYTMFHAPVFDSWERYQAMGFWFDTILEHGLIPILGLIYIRKAVKAHRELQEENI